MIIISSMKTMKRCRNKRLCLRSCLRIILRIYRRSKRVLKKIKKKRKRKILKMKSALMTINPDQPKRKGEKCIKMMKTGKILSVGRRNN